MKRYSKLAILIILKAAVMIGGLAQAAEPPEEPILRIETGMHTAKINRIGVDAAERILVTASDDKTVRVWDIATGNLIKILRVPVGWTKEGMIYAVAISPDGKTVAAGGWTGYSWDKEYSIYIFDIESGNIIRRITGHPATVRHLTFSKDGKYLAAALGEKGIRIYATENWSLKVQDTDYGDRSDWIDFDKNGRAVITSVDGFLRLYDNKFRLISKKQYSGGKEPSSSRFSPDGKKIAVIFRDSSKVYIISGENLSYLYLPDTDGVNKGIISSVAWSSDGASLYIGGADKNETTSVIRKWTREGRGSYTDIPAADNTVMHIIPLKNEGIIFGSADPAFGIIDKNDRKILFKTSQIADYRDNHNNFMVSDDGNTVKFGYEPFKKKSAIFSISSRMIVNDAQVEELVAPITTADGMDISGWKNSFFPIFNGKAIAIEQYEVSRSLAISLDKQHFLIGTELMLRFFDRNGNLKWYMPSPGVAWCVNISGDGRKAVAAFSDGTIRWYRISDHRKLLTFFPHKDGKRWVLWTPSGYYAASAGGDDLIGWHVNNGKDKPPDFFPASRFRSVYYRPDVTEHILNTLDEKEALRIADTESGKVSTQETSISRMLPPIVSIISPHDLDEFSDTEITVRYKVRNSSGEPVTEVKAFVDGRSERGIVKKGELGEIHIKVPRQDCEISLIASNRYTSSEPATIKLLWRGKKAFVVKPKLYLLAIGISEYDRPELCLKFAAKDAEDIAGILKRQEGGIYREISVKILTDRKASRDDVMSGLEWIEKETTSKDVAVIFLAGHGVNDRNGDYYFLPANADPDQLKRTGIPYYEVKNTLIGLPGKSLCFLDTCHAGNIMGDRRAINKVDIDRIVNDLASAENGVVVFAASTGRQYSAENEKWGNGAFTRALIEGLSGKADYTDDGQITINELDLYLSEEVKKLTGGKQTPTTTKPKTIQDFPIAIR